MGGYRWVKRGADNARDMGCCSELTRGPKAGTPTPGLYRTALHVQSSFPASLNGRPLRLQGLVATGELTTDIDVRSPWGNAS